jgi:DNA-binding MarR family transcriptional regulator
MPPAPQSDPLSYFGFLIKDVSRLYSRNFERHSSVVGLTLMQSRVLSHLHRNEGISQVRLADLCDCDPMTLGRLIAKLEEDGLIERRPDPADGRARQLFLRPAALSVIKQIMQMAELARAEAMAGFSAADRSQLIALMVRLRANLNDLLPGMADSSADGADTRKRHRGAA